MAPACSNETILPGIAEEEEGELKENNLLNELPAASCLGPPGYSIVHQRARCTCLKIAGWTLYVHTSIIPKLWLNQHTITYHQTTSQQMQKIHQITNESTHAQKIGGASKYPEWAAVPICSSLDPCTCPAPGSHCPTIHQLPDVLLNIVCTHAFSTYCTHMPSGIVSR